MDLTGDEGELADLLNDQVDLNSGTEVNHASPVFSIMPKSPHSSVFRRQLTNADKIKRGNYLRNSIIKNFNCAKADGTIIA